MLAPVTLEIWNFSHTSIPSVANVLLEHQQVMLAIKTGFLTLGAGWSVISSSNGVADSLTDLWLTDTDLVWGTGGGNRSWIVLQRLGTGPNIQVLIDLIGPGPGIATVKFSVVGFGSGTTSSSPTAPDEIIVLGADNWVPADITHNFVVHVMSTVSGKRTRIVIQVDNVCSSLWLFDSVAEAPEVSVWPAPPVVLGVISRSTVGSVATFTNLFRGARLKGKTSFGLANFYMDSEGYGSQAMGELQTYPTEPDGSWPLSAVGLFTQTTGSVGRWGGMLDIFWGSTARVTGDTYDSGKWAQFDHLVLPWDGSIIQPAGTDLLPQVIRPYFGEPAVGRIFVSAGDV